MGATAMISSIKSNDRRGKRATFGYLNSHPRVSKNRLHIEPVPESVLKDIRQKLKVQRIKERRLQIIFFMIALAIILSLGYQMSFMNGADVNHFFSLFKRG
ncbi:hypothetical protein NBT05_01880 [Aquimarina sp. ERC-38]|uniref:hypothetical protein n=1 Tax=Aquimarina sp. ERC-38 TaxID=2949996 RepID=UPI002245314A|nr:hypothetical protein [Aquimarina sp. ERC-38]UZO81237.1 hypothetical protein NBT05_01880 [Aquimarina sp. ERC-38]